jgi:hypothetical protein
MNHVLVTLIVLASSGAAAPAQDQGALQRDRPVAPRSGIHKLEELTFPQIDALDRQRTLFILPVGIIEEHGPHLPVGADTLGVMYEANGVSRRVSRALPAWNVVMMPAINYGQGGANALGNMLVHPGTYAIRQSTLRSLVADLGGQIAQNGFKWMFVMNGHGGPPHNIAINEACDFVSETFGVTVLHLTGLFRADAVIQAKGQRMNARHFVRGACLVRHGRSCRRRRNIRHARRPSRSGSVQLQSASQPSGPLVRGVARDCDGARLAGLSLCSGEGDGGARPGGRGLVD